MGSAENEVRYTMFAEHILLGEMLFMGFMMFGLPSPTGGTHTDVLGGGFLLYLIRRQTDPFMGPPAVCAYAVCS